MPAATSHVPWPSTIRRTEPRLAPSAIRSPNSRVRWLTDVLTRPGEAGQRDDQRYRREDGEQRRRHARRGEALAAQLIQRLDFLDW